MFTKPQNTNKLIFATCRRRLVFVIIMYLVFINLITAQVSFGGSPKSFSNLLSYKVPKVIMPPVNVHALLQIDSVEQAQGLPFRFGFGNEVSYNLDNSGVWDTLSDGGRIWRLCIFSPSAFSINLIYDQFWLPNGASFFIYNKDTTNVLGAFTSQNNKPHGKFSTGIVKGDKIFLEYFEPEFVETSGTIEISRVIHGYRNLYDGDGGYGESQWCQIPVHCPEGAPWSNEIRSVGMILMDNGMRFGSGALINNVRGDLTPYFLTARHLKRWGNTDTWLFYFNYESCNCSEPSIEPPYHSISGSTFRAKAESSI